MEVHEASKLGTLKFIEDIKKQAVTREKVVEPFMDPLREFSSASRLAGAVRQWLTYPIEERKRLVRSQFNFFPRQLGDEQTGKAAESEQSFQNRQMERWRALCVIIQEESRAAAGNRCPEVAIAALKLLFPEHDWKNPIPNVPPK